MGATENISTDIYRSIPAPAEGLFKDNGSRFIALAYPVETEEEVKEMKDQQRNEEVNKLTQEHEATVSKISDDNLFYLMSRGISEKDAIQMMIMGFIEPFSRELPMEYAVELNQLIKLDMEGSVG